MRLLIFTQKVDKNDPILGFFHRWIEEFANHCESLVVICLEKGECALPGNVKVLSLGKEKGRSVMRYIVRFYRYIWQERRSYDAVFVHMNPEYMALAGWLWRLLGKKTSLWYVHRQTNLKLWLAERFANMIFTSAPESFRLRSRKVRYVGHGIDTELFRSMPKDLSGPISLLHVGRVTRIKNIDVIIKAAKEYPLSIVGEAVTPDDIKYKKELVKLISQTGADVRWFGSVSNSRMPSVYASHSISINATPDGGMDKTVLESLSSGCPVFASNKAFGNLFGQYNSIFHFAYGDSADLARKIGTFLALEGREEVVATLSKRVHADYDFRVLIGKIISTLDA